MIEIGRFSQTSELAPFLSEGADLSLPDALLATELLLHSTDQNRGLRSDFQNVFNPLSDSVLSIRDIRQLLKVLVGNFRRVQKDFPERRNIVIDLDLMPRSIAVILISFIVQVCYFRRIIIIYSEYTYEIDGKPLEDMLATEDFWHEVYNYPSKLFSIPQTPGRFDASLPKTVFVNGGLDFGRLLNLAARWEPQDISLTYPAQIASDRDPALLSAFDSLIRYERSISRMDLHGLIHNLNHWWSDVERRDVQPMLICGGWKLQSVISCMWASENARVPAFACMPDFISRKVKRVSGARWKLDLIDTAIIV